MNPAIPTGWVANDEEWAAIRGICRERDITLLYWMLWEAIVFGGRPIVVPSGLEGMRDLTVTAGAVSLEQRMIGWRVGWMVSSADLAPTLAMVHIYNGVVTSGFGQIGAAVALRIGDEDVRAAVAEWERRHEELVRQCDGLPLVPAHGGWSALLDAEALGLDAPELSRRLLEQKVAANTNERCMGRDGRNETRTARIQQRARRTHCAPRRAAARGAPITIAARFTASRRNLRTVRYPVPASFHQEISLGQGSLGSRRSGDNI